MATKSQPVKDSTYIVGQDTNVIGRENQSAELFINELFDINYITNVGYPIYIKVDPLVSNLIREIAPYLSPEGQTIPNNRTVK